MFYKYYKLYVHMETKQLHEIKNVPYNMDIPHTPGICVMRGVLTFEEQLHFINIITSKGELKDINGSILDAGCGVSPVVPNSPYSVYSDIEPKAVEIMNKRYKWRMELFWIKRKEI